MIIAELYIISKKQKQFKCPSNDEEKNKLWHTTEYYSTIKKECSAGSGDALHKPAARGHVSYDSIDAKWLHGDTKCINGC